MAARSFLHSRDRGRGGLSAAGPGYPWPIEAQAPDKAPAAIAGYAPPSERPPLLAYAILAGIFNALFGGA
jgi:hypothetical protein